MSDLTTSRRRDYDLLRVASMAAVVYLHTAAASLQTMENRALWQFSNLFASLGTAAVPLFFMLSGALLLRSPRTGDWAFVLRRRLPRVLVPGLFWSGLVILGTWRLKGGDAALQMLVHLPNTTVLTPYWFLYALVPMYLLSPLLKRLADGMEESHWRYLLGLWAVLTLGLQSVAYLTPEPWKFFFLENGTLNVSAIGGYLGYFFLGAYLDRLERLPPRWTLWLAVGADWAIITLGTWYFTARTGVYGQQLLDYRGIFAAVLAAGLFLLARSYFGSGRGSGRALTALAGCSFGVYLAHPFAIKAVELVLGEVSGVPGQVLTWLLALAGSILGVMVVQSVKPLCFPVTGQSYADACRESNLFAIFHRKRRD